MCIRDSYNGVRTYDYAVSRGLQFLDGFGGIAASGPYAWDRARGTVYRLSLIHI